jgi:hypothetical protein
MASSIVGAAGPLLKPGVSADSGLSERAAVNGGRLATWNLAIVGAVRLEGKETGEKRTDPAERAGSGSVKKPAVAAPLEWTLEPQLWAEQGIASRLEVSVIVNNGERT